MEEKVIKSFKGFNKDMKCRGFQYEIGKEYGIDGKIEACSRGFHACEYPLDVFGYYAPGVSRYCQVEQSGKIDDSESDKTCSSKIKIGAELTIPGLVKATIDYIRSRCTNEQRSIYYQVRGKNDMKETHYKLALATMWKGLQIFLRSWGVTLNKLLHDTLRGIRHHWFFALMLVTVFGVMFVTMAQSRANYHHLNMVNYELSQSLDSIKMFVK